MEACGASSAWETGGRHLGVSLAERRTGSSGGSFPLRPARLSLWLPPGDAFAVLALVSRGACVPGSHRTVTIRETVFGRLPPPGYRSS